MIGLVLYFLFGWFVIKYERPVHFAAGYSVFNAVLSLIFGDAFVGALLSAAVLFAYTAFVYMVVDRYGDQILAPIGVLIAGAAVLIGAVYYA